MRMEEVFPQQTSM